jgi:hypothetical protein
MPWNVFKNKIKCNKCGDILFSDSDTKWTECSCGATSVMGKSFWRVRGKDYTDVGRVDFNDVPEHRGFDE